MVLNEILQHFKNVKQASANRYEAICPAHDDKHPSLGIYINGDWVNIKCFAGCEEEKVLNAVGLKKSDLYIGSNNNKPQKANETIYSYYDIDGIKLYDKVRTDYCNGSKTFCFVKPNGKYGTDGVKRVPYNLQNVIKADIVYFVEGEKCADSVIEQGYVATTLDSGANSRWLSQYDQYFKGKKVIIIPDNDAAGMKYANKIHKHIPWAVIKKLPGLKEKEDIYDWLKAGHSMAELDNIEETTDFEPEKKTQGETLLSLIKREKIETFLNNNHDAYVSIMIDGHREIWPLESKEFLLWSQRLYYRSIGKTIRNDNISQAIGVLLAETRFEEKSIVKLFNRVANYDNDFWYDLSNQNWSVVRISKTGWSVIEEAPKLFNRYRHQMEQVIPKTGGNIENIFDYINIPKYKTLFICWLVSCFVSDIPHPMPVFYGEKGATKSTVCILLKRLIDPSALDTLSLSRDERTLLVNLKQHYYLPFDNITSISNEISDMLCRAVTGGAVQQRKLHSNDDDCIFTFKRCLTINGINNVAERSDLLDRSIMFELERVSEDKRRELQEVYDSFEADRPYLLGAIFDILSKAMEIYPSVSLDRLPRMADFCRWGYAIAEALGGLGGQFLEEYHSNQSIQNDEAIDTDSVAYLIVELMRQRVEWKGLISELLVTLQNLGQQHGILPNAKALPTTPNYLSRRIKALKSNLNLKGIEFNIESNHSKGTYISINKPYLSPSSPCLDDYVKANDVYNDDMNGDNGDK